jgi:hypothetical protein
MRFQVLKLSQAHQEAPLTCKILEPCAEQLHFHVVEVGIQHVRVQSHHRDALNRIEHLLGDTLSDAFCLLR